MDHQQRHVQRFAVELRVIEPAVLLELLAVVGGDHDRDVAGEAEPLDLAEKPPQDVVGLPDAGVVLRPQPIDHRRRRAPAGQVPAGERLARGRDRAGWRDPLPEQVLVRPRRVVGRVDGVGVEEQEEAVFRPEALQEAGAPPEGLLHLPAALPAAVVGGELVEAAAKAVAPAHVTPLGEGGGAEAVALEHLGERLHLGREHRVGGKHPMLPRVEAGQHRHVGDESAGELGVGLLEDGGPPRQRVQERAGRPAVAVEAEMVGPQGVDRDEDVAAGGARNRRAVRRLRTPQLRLATQRQEGEGDRNPQEPETFPDHGGIVAKRRLALFDRV